MSRHPDRAPFRVHSVDSTRIVDAQSQPVATTFQGRADYAAHAAIRERDAVLLAAAPDLLAALEEIAGGINVPGTTDMVLSGNWHGVVVALQAKARAAIAKAVGA